MGAGVLGGIYLLLLAVAEAWARLGQPHPESTRKLVHLGGGVACLAIPFLVESTYTVLGLALTMVVLFVVGRRSGALQSLNRVERRSQGSELYPLAIFLVYLFARDHPAIYVSSILVLAVADAFAALIGTQYGQVRYTIEDASKSLEGSAGFLVVAFLSIHLPTLLLTDLPREVTVLAALLLALLVTAFENVALEGSDNLLVPLGVCLLLERVTALSAAELVFLNVALVAIAGAVLFAAWRVRSINVGGALVLTISCFAAWALGDFFWALPAMAGIVLYLASWIWGPLPADYLATAKVRLVFRASLPPMLAVVAADLLGLDALLYGPYLAMTTAVVVISGWNHFLWTWGPTGRHRPLSGFGLGLLGSALVAGPVMLALPGASLRAFYAIVLCCALGGALNAAVTHVDRQTPSDQLWDSKRIALTALVGLGVFGLQALGLVAPWPVAT